MLLRRVSGEREISVRWRYFSLTQVNHHGQDGWTVWNAPPGVHVRGRQAFAAAEAARRQGEDVFLRFHRALLDLRHVGGVHADSPQAIEEAATLAGLDHDRLLGDMGDPQILAALARDHQEAVERWQIFGTPSFVFEPDRVAYVRVMPAPAGREALELFDDLVDAIARRPSLLELKRP